MLALLHAKCVNLRIPDCLEHCAPPHPHLPCFVSRQRRFAMVVNRVILINSFPQSRCHHLTCFRLLQKERWLCRAADIMFCRAGDNYLVGQIPDVMGTGSNLQTLTLFNNMISGTIPPSLGNATQLTDLDLTNNTLSGTIPASLGNLVQLKYAVLKENNLTGAKTLSIYIGISPSYCGLADQYQLVC